MSSQLIFNNEIVEDEWETIMKDYTKLNDAWGNDEID